LTLPLAPVALLSASRLALAYALSIGTISFAATVTHAQTRDPVEERRQIEATRHQREEAKKDAIQRDTDIQAELARIQQERESLNTKLLDSAKSIQASEAQLTTLEQRQGELEAQESLIRGSLEKSHGSISGLLAAMQRMGRNPPPVMVTRREDALTMVRSAMLLASAFPELRGQAMVLSGQLNELVRVIDESRRGVEQHRQETAKLQDNKLQLAALIEARKQTVTDRQKELVQVRKDAAEFSRNVSDLNELLAKLDKSISDKTRLGAYEKQLAAETLARQQQAAIDQAPTSPPLAAFPGPDTKTGDVPKKSAAVGKPLEDLRPSITLQPGATLAMASPGRIQPAIPFEQAKGSDGIVIETRSGAQVVSPNDGWIMYAGEFRSYGQILIINAGGGYHILLAGLSQIDVQVGQFVLAGEPIGLMVAAPKTASVKTQETAPVLYVEFRKNQRPVDPGPWWAENARKVAG
jgi:murein hydrolase activator